MTRRLYEEDAFLSRFTATVTELTVHRGHAAVVLDRTAFFPEGGGQPGDTGEINGVEVTDTQTENGVIYHYVKTADGLAAGSTVTGALNWEQRFRRMQAHTGEHIVSGLANSLYGAENVGFHMDDTVMTVDFDLPLTKAQLCEIERRANRCVYENREVTARYPEPEELAATDYRAKLENLANPRIVTIEGYDRCACCAVHVDRTGRVGLIKILTAISHRGGVRLTLVCGETAYEDYVSKHRQTLAIADKLAAKHGETDLAVEKLLQKEKDLRFRLQQKNEQLFAYVEQTTAYAPGSLVFAFADLTPEELKTAALRLKHKCGGLCVAVSGEDRKGYYFAMASDAVKVTDFTKTVTAALQGSGGGRYDVVQGRFGASLEEIKGCFAGIKVN